MLTTSLLLTFASLAFAQQIQVFTETITVTATAGGTVYTSTSTYASTSYPASISSPSTSTSTSTAPAATHTIQVGPGGNLVFSPNNIAANVGDVIQYFFNPKNHTVTQSSFGSPCVSLLESTGSGFDSGFGHNTTVPQDVVGFSFIVNNSNPIWFYCQQTGHCEKGMVGAINAPTSGNTFSAFLAKAEASSSSSATPSGTATGTATGASSSSTGVGTNSSGAIYTSVNVGLTAILAFVGVAILAL